MTTDTLPSITITPAADSYRVSGSKFSGPSAPAAAGVAAEGTMTFADLIDTVNPLQHLPIIGTIYRAVSGDAASTGAKVAGNAAYGALLGGPIGALVSVASAVFGDIFGVDEALSAQPTAVAEVAKKSPAA